MKTLQKPELKEATELTPLQLNAYRFHDKHTLLTPEAIDRAKKATAAKESLK